jgi:hypothetical protein
VTTYSVRCRVASCRHRRVIDRHPDTYVRPPACSECGGKKGWRLESRAYNRRGLCKCSGPMLCDGRWFPHRPTHPLCDQHPRGHVNQALRRGATWDDIPLDALGTSCTSDEAPF